MYVCMYVCMCVYIYIYRYASMNNYNNNNEYIGILPTGSARLLRRRRRQPRAHA